MRAVNLIPAEQRSGAPVGAGRSGGAAFALLGTLAGLALMALLYGIAHHNVSSRTNQVAQLQDRAQQAQSAASQLAPYTSFIALRQQRTQAVETLVNSRFDWAHALHELGRVLPAGASVSTLTASVGPAGATPGAPAPPPSSSASAAKVSASTVASSTPPGSVPTFSLSGCAISQTAVAETLDRLRLMDGVSSVTLASSTKSTSGGGGTGSSSGGCGNGQAAYAVTIAYQPLPAASALPSASKSTVSDTGSTAAPAGGSTTTKGSAR